MCLFMRTLGSYIHACTNETYSLAHLAIRFNPYFGWFLLVTCMDVAAHAAPIAFV